MEGLKTFFDTSGIGGVAVALIVVTLTISYAFTIRWISRGQVDEKEKD